MPQKPWEKYQQQAGPWQKYATARPPSPTLLESRRAASKSEFEANLPESTMLTRAREAAIGVLEPFDLHNVPEIAQSIGQIIYDTLTGNVLKTGETVKGIVTAPAEPVRDIVGGIASGDYDRAAYGAGGFLSKTAPAIQQVGQGVKTLRTPKPGSAQEVYRAALKPSTTLDPSKVNEIVETGLKQKIPITDEGLQRLNQLVDEYNAQIDAKVAGSSASVKPSDVAQRMKSAERTFETQVDPAADLAALEATEGRFLSRHQTPGQPAVAPQPTGILDPSGRPIMTTGKPAVAPKDIPIPAQRAQELKKGTYRQLKGKAYGEMKGADIEAQKQLARGLKEELDRFIPELKELNAAEGKLLDLEPQLERAINRAANANKGRLGPMIAAGTTRVLTGSGTLGTAVGILKGVLDEPGLASRLAIAIYQAQQKNPSRYGLPNMIRARIEAMSRISAISTALNATAQNQR